MPLPLPCPGFHLLLPLLHILCPVIHKHLSFFCRVSWICPWVLVSAVTSQSQVPIKSHINDCSSLLTSFFHFLSNPQAAARLSIPASISLPWWRCCSVAQLCPTFCNPMDCSMPGLPMPHHLLEFAQVHVHYIDDDILSWVFCLDSTSISSSDTFVSFCLQSFSSSGTFLMSRRFASDDQNTGASASALVLPETIQGWSPLRLTGLISLLSKGLSGIFSSTTVQRHQFFGVLPSLRSSSHNCTWPLGKTIALSIWTFVSRGMSLLFSRLLKDSDEDPPLINSILASLAC